MDLSKFLNIIRRYSWLFVLVTMIASLTTFFVLNNQPAVFEVKTRLLVGPNLDSPSPDLNSLKIGGQLIQTYAELVNTRPFLEKVNSKLDQKTDPESLARMIETRQNNDTRILTIFVRHRDPNQAVAIANAAAETLIEMSPSTENTATLLRTQMKNQSHQLEQIISSAESSIQRLETELIALGSSGEQAPEAAKATLERQNLVVSQLAEERTRLSDALRTLATIYQVLLDTNTNQLEIIEPAEAVFPVDQNVPLKAIASGIAGLTLAVSIIFASAYFDDTIRVPGDFGKTARIPLLSIIDRHDHLDGPGLERAVSFAQPKSRAANGYRTAAAKLLFSIGDSLPHTFLLSSAGSQSGDDAATAAMNLAVIFAQTGDRVVVVDAQLHNPLLTKLFKTEDRVGLCDFMETNSTKLLLMSVKEMPGIRFLPAGLSSEKGSGAMLNSMTIAGLLEELRKDADIVLVAGPPISSFAESLAWAPQVNGIILVARHGEAHAKTVHEVVENFSAMNVQLAGAIFDQNPSPNLVPKQDARNLLKVANVTSEIKPEPLSKSEQTVKS